MTTGLPIIDLLLREPVFALFFLIGIVLAVTVHEFAHAYAAARQGDMTAKHLGRVSLNPLAHLDPAGSLLFLLAGFGWGKPVPVNPYNLRDGKRGDFYVSIAGIVTNLVTAFVFALPLQILHSTGDVSLAQLASGENLGLLFCATVAYVNVLLAAFNLLPIPPLDGSKAIGILIPERFEDSYQRFLQVGPVLLLGLFMADYILRLGLIGTLMDPILALFQFITFLPTSLSQGL